MRPHPVTWSQTNSVQAVTSTLTPDAFGQTVAATGSTASAYGYAGDWGYRSDGDAGLMLVGARYYDAQVGRFASRDTYLDQHPYLYCDHDGVNWVDPSGHDAWWPYVGGLVRIVTIPVVAGAILYIAARKLHDHMRDNGNARDGFSSGHGGAKPGRGDINSLMNAWEKENHGQ